MTYNFLRKWLFFKESIQAKIFLSVLLVTVFTIAVISWVFFNNAADTIRTITTHYIVENMKNSDVALEAAMREADAMMLSIVLNRNNIVNMLANETKDFSVEAYQERKQADDFMSSLTAYKYNIKRITMVGTNGKIFNAGNAWVDANACQSDWGKKIIEGMGTMVILNRPSESKSQPDITLGRVLYQKGQVKGIVFVDVDYSFMQKAFEGDSLKGSLISVFDNTGAMAYSSYAQKDSVVGEIYKFKFLQLYAAGTDKEDGQGETVLDGQKYLTVYYKSKYSRWTTIGLIPEKLLMLNTVVLRERMVIVVIVVCLLLMAVSIMLSSTITNNIRKLQKAMQIVGADNMDISLSIESKDEIGQLTRGFVSMMKRINSLVEDIRITERRKKEAELETLQAQISPHFLYNTLNTVRYLAGIQNVPNIEEVTTSLIELLRASLKNKGELITIQEELEYVKDYLIIQKYRFTNRFSAYYEIEPEVLEYKMPKMILQPIIENSIIHGIENIDREGIIDIKIYMDKDIIRFSLTDNGGGMGEEQISRLLDTGRNEDKQRLSGIGLGNVNERIKLLVGDEFGLRIFSVPGNYTKVEFVIPCIRDEEGDKNVQSTTGR